MQEATGEALTVSSTNNYYPDIAAKLKEHRNLLLN